MDDWPTSSGSALASAASQAISAGDPFEAVTHFERAIREGARDPITLANYGILLWRLFEFRQGEEAFNQVVEDLGTDPATLRRVAHCYFEIGRFGKAADVMRVAVARTSEADVVTTNTLAWTLERDHQTDEARHYAEAAHAMDKSYGPAVRLLAHLDRRAGEFERAEERLIEQLRRYPSDFNWGLNYELASVLDRLGKYDVAWSALYQAKSQLAEQTADHLRDSYFIRRRQWELAQSVTAADLRRWHAAGASLSPPKRLAFLTGFPRSGTTLLEQIIATNADVVDTDESGILPRQFLEPLVWKADDAMTAIVELRSFEIAQLVAGREMFYQLTESYLDQPIGGRLLIEKNPLLTADLALALRLFPEALLLIALRDPRDVVLSYLFTMVPLNWSSAPAIDVAEACQFYADTMRHWLWWRSRLEWPWCEIRYEQVITDPLGETKRVADFLGLAWDSAMLDERRRSERKAVRTPTYDDVTKPLYTRAIGRWQNYQKHLEPGLKTLQPYLAEFHYEK
jgi:tetratricopeptide (TPR) repeat protein